MSAAYLNDRQRVELALPARLFYALAVCDVFAVDPAHADTPDAAEKGMREVAELRDLLKVACIEPIADIDPRKAGQLSRRIDRVAKEVTAEYDQERGIKLALVFYYWLEDLLSRGVLVCHEGSTFGRAIRMLFTMFQHGFAIEKQDASAQKQARRLLEKFQVAGYFR